LEKYIAFMVGKGNQKKPEKADGYLNPEDGGEISPKIRAF
jgi:hypothetical protein